MDLANATVGQLLVPVENLEAAVSFYRDILGLQHLFSAPPQMAFFQCGQIRLLVGVLPAGQTAQRGAAIYFQVSDILAVFQTLSEKDVKFVAAPHVVQRTPSSEQWLAEFTDPDGNQLALMSQTTTSAGPVH
ncbi:MAG TPA: VOC family protein [Casimicrobiaceae bacterium]|jgi:predicted enzyme related to lactoylglutathione lyase|nr:VOC family protein [Casimicrobiaceae bacterium]